MGNKWVKAGMDYLCNGQFPFGPAKRNWIGEKTMNGRMDGASRGPEMEKEWELLGKLMYTGIEDGKNFVKD